MYSPNVAIRSPLHCKVWRRSVQRAWGSRTNVEKFVPTNTPGPDHSQCSKKMQSFSVSSEWRDASCRWACSRKKYLSTQRSRSWRRSSCPSYSIKQYFGHFLSMSVFRRKTGTHRCKVFKYRQHVFKNHRKAVYFSMQYNILRNLISFIVLQ